MGVYDYTVYDFIRQNSRVFPERDCIVFNGNRLNFKQYKEQCDQVAAGLIKAGMKAGCIPAITSSRFILSTCCQVGNSRCSMR